MTTPTPSRRSFLRSLALLVTAPFAARALIKSSDYTLAIDPSLGPERPDQHAYAMRGVGIKVPSNRWHAEPLYDDGERLVYRPIYVGDWDGTFHVERGCSNPAYILADLYERTGAAPDWVVWQKGQLPGGAGPFEARSRLHWRMLYDWGRDCDQLVTDETEDIQAVHVSHRCLSRSVSINLRDPEPRFTVNAVVQTPEEMAFLRETLRMRCLQWQSRDPRYRTSYPGLPS